MATRSTVRDTDNHRAFTPMVKSGSLEVLKIDMLQHSRQYLHKSSEVSSTSGYGNIYKMLLRYSEGCGKTAFMIKGNTNSTDCW